MVTPEKDHSMWAWLIAGALTFALTISPTAAAELEVVYKSCPNDVLDDVVSGKSKPQSRNCAQDEAPARRGVVVVKLSGTIQFGDVEKLRRVLDRNVALASAFGYNGSFVTIMMDSEGGDYDEGIRLGRFFRDEFIHTRITREASCISACALAFMGGTSLWGRREPSRIERQMEAGGRLVFHSPFAVFDAQTGTVSESQMADVFRDV